VYGNVHYTTGCHIVNRSQTYLGSKKHPNPVIAFYQQNTSASWPKVGKPAEIKLDPI